MFRSSLMVMCIALSSCYKANISGFSDRGSPGRTEKVLVHGVIEGLIPLTEVDAKKVCGDKGVWSIQTKMGIVPLIATALTLGVYSPMNVVVTCRE